MQLHQKYAKDGLVAISVSLDDPKDKNSEPAVLKFLRGEKEKSPMSGKKAAFTNLILDESQEFWQKKFRIDGPPSVFVFNREGKWKQFKEAGHYPEVEQLVVEWLKKK